MPSKRIGSSRSSRIYRLGGLIYFSTVGWAVFSVFGILAGIFAAIDVVGGIILNRPINFGRTIGTAPARHHISLGKWVAWGEEFPGFLPSGEHTSEAAV